MSMGHCRRRAIAWLGDEGNREADRSPAFSWIISLNVPSMRFDDRLRYRKSDAQTGGFSGYKRLKNLWINTLIYPRAVIRDANEEVGLTF